MHTEKIYYSILMWMEVFKCSYLLVKDWMLWIQWNEELSYRIQMYLEDITHNASFFYYNSDFVLVANAITEEFLCQLAEGALKRGKNECRGWSCV